MREGGRKEEGRKEKFQKIGTCPELRKFRDSLTIPCWSKEHKEKEEEGTTEKGSEGRRKEGVPYQLWKSPI
jgi:hypothetical protein